MKEAEEVKAIPPSNRMQENGIMPLVQNHPNIDLVCKLFDFTCLFAAEGGLEPAPVSRLPSRPEELHLRPLTDSGRDALASSGSCSP